MPLDQQAILARAKSHLAVGTVESLRYAARECRLLMEELTYEKLRASADLLPEAELNRWQPREAVKMLLAIDPHADQGVKIEISADPLPEGWEPTKEDYERLNWVPLGDHHALSLKWLQNYHKVGGLLHAPRASEVSVMPIEKQSKLLSEVVAELEKAAGSSLKSMIWRGGIGFQCIGCRRQVLANIVHLRKGALSICPNDDCQFEYVLVKDDDGEQPPRVTPLGPTLACHKCSSAIHIARRKLKAGHEFGCDSCSARYKILEPKWPVEMRQAD